MRILILKLKQVQSALKMWSCERIGDILSKIATAESKIEEEVRECSSEGVSTRPKWISSAHQKARIKWMAVGDANSAYFHARCSRPCFG